MAKPTIDPITNKPLPLPARPGTAGTELLLKTNRRDASNAFKRAERAERAYVAKKKAAAARTGTQEAKEHLRIARKEFKLGLGKLWDAVKAVPSLLSERREVRRRGREERLMRVAEEKRALWEGRRREMEEGVVGGVGEGDGEGEGVKEGEAAKGKGKK